MYAVYQAGAPNKRKCPKWRRSELLDRKSGNSGVSKIRRNKASGVSNKALFHRKGDLVYKNEANGEYEPIDPIIENINKEIERLEKEIEELNDAVAENEDNEAETSNKSSKNKLKQELKQKKAKIKHLQNKINFYHKHSKKLIDLNNTIDLLRN